MMLAPVIGFSFTHFCVFAWITPDFLPSPLLVVVAFVVVGAMGDVSAEVTIWWLIVIGHA